MKDNQRHLQGKTTTTLCKGDNHNIMQWETTTTLCKERQLQHYAREDNYKTLQGKITRKLQGKIARNLYKK